MVSDLDSVKKELDQLGEADFVRRYAKADALIGPGESVEFINDKITNFYKS